MLIGEFESRFGEKNRIAVPKKIREELGEKLIITRGYEKSLIMVDETRWKSLIASIEVKPLLNAGVRDMKRYLVGGAYEAELDSQGRFVLSNLLKEFAGIEKEVVFVAIENWVEIWDKSLWTKKIDSINKSIEDLADRMSS